MNVEISYNECIGPSCILRETRVIRPGILVVRGVKEDEIIKGAREELRPTVNKLWS